MLAAKASRNAPTDGLGDASTNFDVWLPDNHSRLDRATFRRKQPFAIRIGKTLDGDHADVSR
jgi:hypothetical protein